MRPNASRPRFAAPWSIAGRSSPPAPVIRRASHTMTVTPSSVVATPTGMKTPRSAPTAARSATSAPTMTTAPHRPLNGSRTLCGMRPGTRWATRRAATGAASPAKPIGPATVTAHAARSSAATTARSRVRLTWTPRLEAVSSPRRMMSSLAPIATAPPTARTTSGAVWRIGAKPVSVRFPEPHANRPIVSCWNKMSRSETMAFAAIAVAEPARMSLVVAEPPPDAMASTSAAVAIAPRKATPTPESSGSEMPKAATTVTARYAPAFTASVSGLARGLRATDWSRPPETPRAMPTRTPAARRGRRAPDRTFHTPWSAAPTSRRSRSPVSTAEVPCVRWRAASATRTPAVTVNIVAVGRKRVLAAGVSGRAGGVRVRLNSRRPRRRSRGRARTSAGRRTSRRRRAPCTARPPRRTTGRPRWRCPRASR